MADDWKSRSEPAEPSSGDWKSRSEVVPHENKPSLGNAFFNAIPAVAAYNSLPSPSQAGRSAVNALPMIGATAGGILGTPADAVAGPMGNVVGAGIGGYMGTAAKNLINSYVSPEDAPQTTGAALLDPIVGGVKAAGTQAGGELLGEGIKSVSPFVAEYLKKKADALYLASTKIPGATAYNKLKDNAADVLRKYVNFGNTQGEIAENLAEGETQAGEKLQESIGGLDQAGSRVNRNDVLAVLRKNLAELEQDESKTDVADALRSKIEDIENVIPQEEKLSGFQPSGSVKTIQKAGPIQVQKEIKATPIRIDPNPMREAFPWIKPEDAPAQVVRGQTQPIQKALYTQGPEEAVQYQPIQPKYETVQGDPTVPLSKSENIKTGFDQTARWDISTPAPQREASKIVANAYRTLGEKSAEATSPELAQQFTGAKQDYGDVTDLAELAGKKASVYSQGPSLNLHALRPGAIGAALGGEEGYRHGGIPGAVAGIAAGAVIGPRVLSSSAIGADWLKHLVEQAPNTLGKWAAPLTQAAQRGGNSLPATDFLLQQTDPEYRQHLNNIRANQDEDK